MTPEIPAALEGERVDRVLSMLFGLPRREAAALVANGAVLLGGSPVAAASRRVTSGQVLEVTLPPPATAQVIEPEPAVGFVVVHVDEEVIVVDKPAGLVVHPGAGHRTGTLVHGLLARFPDIAAVGQAERPGIVHRLDVGTSGLMVVARTAGAYDDLVDQLATRRVERRYLAMVGGHFDVVTGEIDAPIGRSAARRTAMAVTAGGRSARTSFEVLDQYREPVEAALLECRLTTGRTHQIRVHLAAIGHPVIGDSTYRGDGGGRSGALSLVRPFLHAHRLTFDSPGEGGRMSFASPLPADLEEVRERFR